MLAIHNSCQHILCLLLLQTLLQSYQNVSNSQQNVCFPYEQFAANAFAKLSKCQQFTTKKFNPSYNWLLQTLLQSYQNVSNSQLIDFQKQIIQRCKRFCKVIKMLAIHNTPSPSLQFFSAANAFAKLSKCQQFTTRTLQLQCVVQLQTLLQSYQNVSNSQLNYKHLFHPNCCKRFCKVIKMLAIHN